MKILLNEKALDTICVFMKDRCLGYKKSTANFFDKGVSYIGIKELIIEHGEVVEDDKHLDT